AESAFLDDGSHLDQNTTSADRDRRTETCWPFSAAASRPRTLSAPAVALLKTYWRARRGDDALVFSIGGKKPLSDMTLSKLLKALNVGSYTVHGFRSSFTDWAAERTRFPKEVADKALAHRIPDQVEAAYRRTDFFEKRGKLMSAWANYLHGQSSAKASVRASNSRARKK
ncbi:tyrosine-type recombinase/integrase, partial [Sphingomonas koreensis]|uniref:tyrosine-type recombinase/integrase n=1 Tax=Sphingomonas koreensis TaxID=93064 RepID=UPI003BAACDAF